MTNLARFAMADRSIHDSFLVMWIYLTRIEIYHILVSVVAELSRLMQFVHQPYDMYIHAVAHSPVNSAD